VDTGEAAFQVQANVASAYGTFSIDAAGHWSYLLNNSLAQVQALNAGQSLQDAINVKTLDDTSQAIQITVNGTNEPVAVVVAPAFAATAMTGQWQWGFTNWNALSPFGNLNDATALSEVTRILTNGYTYEPAGGTSLALVNGIYNYPGPVNTLDLTFSAGATLVKTFDFVSSRSSSTSTVIKIEGKDAATGVWSVLGNTTAGALGVSTGVANAYEVDVVDAVVSQVRITLTGSQLSLHEIAFNEALGFLV